MIVGPPPSKDECGDEEKAAFNRRQRRRLELQGGSCSGFPGLRSDSGRRDFSGGPSDRATALPLLRKGKDERASSDARWEEVDNLDIKSYSTIAIKWTLSAWLQESTEEHKRM